MTPAYHVISFATFACLSYFDTSLASFDDIDNTISDDAIFSNTVQTTMGVVRGMTELVYIKDGREVDVDVFWGIPFAKPPVGDLRFKRPIPADPWTGVWDATRPPNSCMQILEEDPVLLPNPTTPVSEDCLYLNIWRPRCRHATVPEWDDDENDDDNIYRDGTKRDDNDEEEYSVVFSNMATMVWFHGGGYMTGSSTVPTYNGAVLAATECVIVVSFNYRLGALGFMYLDVPEVPGNMGLLDMTLAVKWVKDNIENFGGDENSITIFGNSAGAASTALFLLSPLTQDLFQRAIIQSGSPISLLEYGSRGAALETAQEFSKAFGCYSHNNTEIAQCLSQVDALTLTKEHHNLAQDYKHFMTSVVDDYFLTQLPLEALDNGTFKRCNLLLGSTQDEGTYFMGLKWADIYSFTQEQGETITEQVLDWKLAEFFSDFIKTEYIPGVLDDVKRVYQLNLLRVTVVDAHLTLLDYVIGDVINTCTVRHIASQYANNSQDAFLYSFNHHLDRTRLASWTGAIHGSELDFVFGRASVDSHDFTPREAELSAKIMTLWANFAKFGTPTPSNKLHPKWLPYTAPDPGNVVIFTSSADVIVGTTEDRRCVYWDNLPQEYLK